MLISRSSDGWKYLAQTSAVPSGWQTAGFADTEWSPAGSTATTPFQTGETIPGSTAIPANPANGTRPYNTVYFLRRFDVANSSAFTTLAINCLRDDGVAIYLNGQPLKRDNLPATGELDYNTPANSTINGSAETTWQTYSGLPVTALVAGSNLLAVELHQADITGTPPLTNSSDLRFDLELLGKPPVPFTQVNAEAASLGDSFHLLWNEPGLILQSSPDLHGPWLDHPEATAPFAIEVSAPRMFYRLRRP